MPTFVVLEERSHANCHVIALLYVNHSLLESHSCLPLQFCGAGKHVNLWVGQLLPGASELRSINTIYAAVDSGKAMQDNSNVGWGHLYGLSDALYRPEGSLVITYTAMSKSHYPLIDVLAH